MIEPAPVHVAEVTAERDIAAEPEIPWHITPQPGTVAMQLRTTLPRITMGSGVARRPGMLEAVRALAEVPATVVSPVAGTFVMGGPAWLGLCAIGALAEEHPLPLDWMVRSLRAWFDAALEPCHAGVEVGRVDGAWCPGFSDIAVQGRKLAGLGFRVTREWVLMRGVLQVAPMPDADLAALQACHRLIGVEVRGETAIPLTEVCGDSGLTVAAVIERFRHVRTG